MDNNTKDKNHHSGCVDDLLRTEVLDRFDRAAFEREGYWIWKGILTEQGRLQWTASLQRIQQMNDEIVMDTDWAAIDFKGRGLRAPEPEKITKEFLASCRGGSEQMRFMPPGLRDYMYHHGLLGPGPALVTRGYESQGIMPEYFPGAYDDFILDATTSHPQMMRLFKHLLGERFLLDHCLTLNRTPGSSGRRWHAHQYREGQYEIEDPIGTGNAVTAEYLKQQCVRTLCYPEGATVEHGGQLSVIPGAHLYRIPFKWNSVRTDTDNDMKASWLKNKIHPATGRPLEILPLDLPPGSMVSFPHHMPHHVTPCLPDTSTRWGLLMALRTPDPNAAPARWNMGSPTHWVERMIATEQHPNFARQVFEADNPEAL
jgi:hypothetical protein